MNNRLFVGNLSAGITESIVRDLFAQKGRVSEVKLMLDRVTGLSRGCAYVTMATPEEAATALNALHSHSLDGRNISVSEARPEDKNPAGQIGESYTMKRHL